MGIYDANEKEENPSIFFTGFWLDEGPVIRSCFFPFPTNKTMSSMHSSLPNIWHGDPLFGLFFFREDRFPSSPLLSPPGST